jgi:hypothetical protein
MGQTVNLSVGGNGAFTIGEKGLKPGAFTDGLAKTAFFAERTKGVATFKHDNSIAKQGLDPRDPFNAAIITWANRTNDVFDHDELFDWCANNNQIDTTNDFYAAGRWADDEDYSNGWPFAGYSNTQYNHVLPPNFDGADCASFSSIPDTPFEHAAIAARSTHKGVAVVAFGDGHTETVSSDIDLQVWRSQGSRNGDDDAGD